MQRSSTLRLLLAASCALTTASGIRAEVFGDVGINATRVEADIANVTGHVNSTSSGLHVGLGVRRELTHGGNIGVRLELDDIDSDLLLAIRALDYRHSFSERFALGAFIGAARLDLATPAHGYYFGGGVQLKEIISSWDLSVDLRFGDNLARDNLLPTDPQGGSNDNFYSLSGLSVYLSHRF